MARTAVKVAMLSYLFPTTEKGGAASYAYELSKALSLRGHKVTVFAPKPKLEKEKTLLPFAIRFVSIAHLPGFRFFSFAAQMKTLSSRSEFDVIHSNAGSGLMASRIDVETHHHLPVSLRAYPSYVPVYFTLRRARKIIAVGSTSGTDLAAVGIDPAKVVIIEHGVDAHRYKPQNDKCSIRRKLGLPEKIIFLYVGGIYPDKKIDLAINAVSRAVKSGRDAFFLIIGNGPEERSIHSLCVQQIPGRFRTLSYVSDSLLPLYYAASDIFLFPSKKEGFGLVLLEAASCGLSIISNDVGVARRLYGEGLCHIANSEEDFVALCIEHARIFSEPNWYGNEFVQKTFSWDLCATRVEELYKSVLS